MTTSLLEKWSRQGQGRRHQPGDRDVWACENCRSPNLWPRKRCADCGTSRY